MKVLAPQVGFEPTTLRLTAECSTIELLRSNRKVLHLFKQRPLAVSIFGDAFWGCSVARPSTYAVRWTQGLNPEWT